MKKCKNCGAMMTDEANNCPKCGALYSENIADNIGRQAGDAYRQIAGSDHTAEFDFDDISKNKSICAISYLSILFFLPLLACPDSRFGRFHANQALLILILGVILSTVASIIGALGLIPFIGGVFSTISGILSAVFTLLEIALVLFGIINTANGKAIELPLIGKLKLIK